MKYKAIIETDEFEDFEFFEDDNGKYIHGIDTGSVNGEWIALYFTECKQELCEDVVSRQAVLNALDKSKYSNEFCEEHHIDWSINLGMAHIVVNELKPVTPQPKTGYISIDDVMSVFDDFMCDEVDEEGTETFLEMLKDRTEREG